MKKIVSLIIGTMISLTSNAQSNYEKAEFAAKCSAWGIYVRETDEQATPELKERAKKWVLSIDKLSRQYINFNQYQEIRMKEVEYLAKKGNRAYLVSQLEKCTKVFGEW